MAQIRTATCLKCIRYVFILCCYAIDTKIGDLDPGSRGCNFVGRIVEIGEPIQGPGRHRDIGLTPITIADDTGSIILKATPGFESPLYIQASS